MTTPNPSSQFSTHLSFLTSRSDAQRRDSLSFLASHVSTRSADASLPKPLADIIAKVRPLVLDRSSGVRAQLLRFLRCLPPNQVGNHVEEFLPYFRAGMTHLAAEIQSSTLDMLGWALEVAGTETVTCPGGWVKTLKCFLASLGWSTEATNDSWSRGNSLWEQSGLKDNNHAKTLHTLALFLRIGLEPNIEEEIKKPSEWPFPLWQVEAHMIPKRSHAFRYLNLFGPPRDEDGEMYEDREERQRIFHKRFQSAIEKGLEVAKGSGGDIGRAAANVKKVLFTGIKDFEPKDEA